MPLFPQNLEPLTYGNSITEIFFKSVRAKLHHFDAAPDPVENFDAVPVAPMPTSTLQQCVHCAVPVPVVSQLFQEQKN
jgi:hypothetical protein